MPEKNYLTDQPIPPQTAVDFLEDVRRLVGFQEAIGIEGYPRTPELARLLAERRPARRQPAAALEKSGDPASGQAVAIPDITDTNLSGLKAEMQACQRCLRHQNRNKAIPGAGPAGVKLMLIVDAPTAEDDLAGSPLTGEPGLLLDRMLTAIGLSRAEVHLSLLIRCHADGQPDPEMADACLPFLRKEITQVSPLVICAMGTLAAQKLLGTGKPLSRLRGSFHQFQGIALMPTFAPDFLLKNPEMKKATWQDLQMIQKKLKNEGCGQ